MKCENCGTSASRRIAKERLAVFPYPHVDKEWWCPKCYYPKYMNGHSSFWRRYLPIR